MAEEVGTIQPARRGGRRKGSGKRADPGAPWSLRAIQALADGSRWQIIQYISDREATVGVIAHALGLSVACVSKHLSILHAAGLIEIRRSGRQAHCRLASRGSEAERLLRAVGIEAGPAAGAAPDAVGPRPRLSSTAAPELESPGVANKYRYQSNDLDDYLL